MPAACAALLARLGDLLDLDAADGATASTLGENIAGAEGLQRRRDPAARQSAGRRAAALAVLRGNLAPDGAVIKPAAMRAAAAASTPARRWCSTTTTTWRRASTTRRSTSTTDQRARAAERRPAGRARACPNGASCRSRRSCCKQGVRDMVRISDARMSGTSYGACVLHVAPESFVGGPLALVRDGDLIELDVAARTHRPAGRRRGAGAPPRRVEAARAAVTRAATARCTCSTSRRPTRAATSISWRPRNRNSPADGEPEIH